MSMIYSDSHRNNPRTSDSGIGIHTRIEIKRERSTGASKRIGTSILAGLVPTEELDSGHDCNA